LRTKDWAHLSCAHCNSSSSGVVSSTASGMEAAEVPLCIVEPFAHHFSHACIDQLHQTLATKLSPQVILKRVEAKELCNIQKGGRPGLLLAMFKGSTRGGMTESRSSIAQNVKTLKRFLAIHELHDDRKSVLIGVGQFENEQRLSLDPWCSETLYQRAGPIFFRNDTVSHKGEQALQELVAILQSCAEAEYDRLPHQPLPVNEQQTTVMQKQSSSSASFSPAIEKTSLQSEQTNGSSAHSSRELCCCSTWTVDSGMQGQRQSCSDSKKAAGMSMQAPERALCVLLQDLEAQESLLRARLQLVLHSLDDVARKRAHILQGDAY